MDDNQTLLDSVDARTKLAGSNKMEILLFSLGTKEVFGINVFKVREVTRTPPITPCPNMPQGVQGVISLRGNIIPVLDLSKFLGVTGEEAGSNATMMVTEYSRRTQGFLVHAVDRIVRVDWDRVRAPDAVLSGHQGLITAVTQLADGSLISILDVEQILANAFGESPVPELAAVRSDREHTVFFVDDSMVARKEITAVLEKLAIKHHSANNGVEAWERLKGIASRAQAEGKSVDEAISVILVDAEMPEMDGYVLTRNIKADTRFASIPVVMHSSLSSEANRAMGKSVGVDAYVAKFDPGVLADTLRPLLK
jgi:two-component system, chemotaxis family, chemotaxis protein CheV